MHELFQRSFTTWFVESARNRASTFTRASAGRASITTATSPTNSPTASTVITPNRIAAYLPQPHTAGPGLCLLE